MTKIAWSQEFSVGFDEIDDQHKKIIDLYNEIDESKTEEDNIKAEKKLGEYIDRHFKYEHNLMEESKYANKMNHVGDHLRLIELYKMIKRKDGNKNPVMKIIVYKWFVEHVINDDMDKHLGRFLKDRSAQPSANQQQGDAPATNADPVLPPAG